MVRLILVRHGQTRSNVHGLLDTGLPGPGLTELGQEQAASLVDVLAGERIDRVVASPLTRTVETATPLVTAAGLMEEDQVQRVLSPARLSGIELATGAIPVVTEEMLDRAARER